jgi:hypothetical protein
LFVYCLLLFSSSFANLPISWNLFFPIFSLILLC